MQKLFPLPLVTEGDISVNVTDGTDAINGATVVLTDSDSLSKSTTTDSDGEATFEDIDNGTYTLTVSKAGYTTETKTVVVAGDVSVDVELAVTRTISFTVNDGTDAVQGAEVVIDGDTAGKKTTGSSGGCTATLTDGEHAVVITATGFEDKTETITTDSTHTSFTISLTTSG